MSTAYSIRNYPREHVHPLGTKRKKKYLKLFLLVVLIAVTGTAYLAYTSGIFTDASPEIPPQMMTRINLERQSNDLQPLDHECSPEKEPGCQGYPDGLPVRIIRYRRDQRFYRSQIVMGSVPVRFPADYCRQL
jgi:hypothetical protein